MSKNTKHQYGCTCICCLSCSKCGKMSKTLEEKDKHLADVHWDVEAVYRSLG